MNKQKQEKSKPIMPYINEDGWYAQCPVCYTEIYPKQDCPKCGQLIDWSWFKSKWK